MKIFTHALYTWLLANFLSPICWIAWDVFKGEQLDDLVFYLMLFLYSLLASLGGLFVSWFVLKCIVSFRYTIYEKVFLWYLSGVFSTLLGIELLSILLSSEFISINELFYITPIVVPVLLSITIRYKYFTQLISLNNKP